MNKLPPLIELRAFNAAARHMTNSTAEVAVPSIPDYVHQTVREWLK